MAAHDDPPDGLSRLTELLRSAPAGASTCPSRPPIDPVARRHRRRRALIVWTIVVTVVAAIIGSYAGLTLTSPVRAATATLAQPDVPPQPKAASPLAGEGESAISVAGADAYLGLDASGVWASSSDDPAPIASISKLVTAMVILDAKPLASVDAAGPRITFDKADHDLYDKYYVLGATIAPMPTGSSLSEHDALETMLVVSACNYAEALADWAYGSVPSFLSATKRWLAKNGLTHTAIHEPTGLDDHNVSTPGDLIALGKLAMANPAIAAIVGTQVLDIAGSSVSGMRNTNDLLGSGPVNGIKTGTLDGSGSDLLFSATLTVPNLPGGPLRVIGVVLGGASHESVDGDADAMLRAVTNGFHQVDLGRRGDIVGTYTTRWGASAHIVLDGSPSVMTWSDTAITATMTPAAALTTGSAGRKVGSITWTAGNATVSVPVVLDRSIRPPSAWWRLTHPFALGR